MKKNRNSNDDSVLSSIFKFIGELIMSIGLLLLISFVFALIAAIADVFFNN